MDFRTPKKTAGAPVSSQMPVRIATMVRRPCPDGSFPCFQGQADKVERERIEKVARGQQPSAERAREKKIVEPPLPEDHRKVKTGKQQDGADCPLHDLSPCRWCPDVRPEDVHPIYLCPPAGMVRTGRSRRL
ncbi:MAG: hypothetical protein WBN83_16995 [Desulfoprunum sp.]|jgi:hypothetical protein|uniref:hypothetical protein n=1 Tax=Desulfoprunum sp. TaxID=2020866 RepID=UPI00052E3563|nr:hypothetical protein JT06_14285 [Desulfobulbus sp. Tol-SR]